MTDSQAHIYKLTSAMIAFLASMVFLTHQDEDKTISNLDMNSLLGTCVLWHKVL